MMQKVEKVRVRLAGRPVPLLSGEFHFWRSPRRCWPAVLEAIRELGLEMVATYVCWEHHELSPGRFDFEGKTLPERDLTGFLDLAAAKGLKVFLRPGPYIYGEWRNLGVPDRAARLPRTSRAFQETAMPYLRRLCRAVLPYLAGRGGPVVLWQGDNEIDCMPWAYGTYLGVGSEAGAFQSWLRRRYREVNRLNRRWGTRLGRFEDARALRLPGAGDPRCHARYLDWIRFRRDENLRHARWVVNTYRRLGVDVPMVLNSYPKEDTLHWRSLKGACHMLGIDPYPSPGFAADPGEHLRFMVRCKALGALGGVPYLAELSSGYWQGLYENAAEPGPAHQRLLALTALACGIQGWNWYMLVERDRWRGSPVDNRGRKRSRLWKTFRKLAEIHRTLDPPRLRLLTSTAVTRDSLHAAFDAVPADDPATSSLYQAAIPFILADLEGGGDRPPALLLFYSGPDWLHRNSQRTLRRWVEHGGKLVFPGIWPCRDEHGLPHDAFGIPFPDLAFGDRDMVLKLGGGAVLLSGPFRGYGAVKPPGRPLFASISPPRDAPWMALHQGLLAGRKCCVGFQKKVGQGSVLWLGTPVTPDLALLIHRRFRAALPARSLTPGIQALLQARGRRERFLFLLNLNDRARAFRVSLDKRFLPPGRTRAVDLVHGRAVVVRDMGSFKGISGTLGGRDATVIAFS